MGYAVMIGECPLLGVRPFTKITEGGIIAPFTR